MKGPGMTLAQVTLFPEQASTVAEEVDALFWFILFICGFFTVLIAWLVMYFAIKYRRRSEAELPRPIKGSLKLEIAWTIMPLVVGLVIFVWSARVYLGMYRPPDGAMNIYVVGRQWMWKLQHPGGEREINALHVPRGEPVKLTMISEDVIHSFYVPAFRIKQDVLPGRYSTIWFQATKAGTYDLFCAEYCGTGHSKMRGSVMVLEPAEYQRWLDERAEGSAALEGRKLFLKLRCISCHNRDGQARAPLLEGLWGETVRFADGSATVADDDYLRRSILDPKEQVVAGFQPIMPTFRGQVSEEEILNLIAYMRSLGAGDTPARVERTEPPVAEPQPEPPDTEPQE
jgi:cytochrome c oxidase subunit 2